MKIELFIEEARLDSEDNQFFVCRLWSRESIKTGQVFDQLYTSKWRGDKEIILTTFSINLTIEKMIAPDETRITEVVYGHRAGIYLTGFGLEKVAKNMTLTKKDTL